MGISWDDVEKYAPVAVGAGAGFLVGGPAGAAVGAGMGMQYAGAQDANRTNVQIAKDASQMNLTSAREQMAFQREMSNTAHQRETLDLQKSGLNPIMAAKQGASTPAGASANAATAEVKNPFDGMADSALSAYGKYLEQRKLAADIDFQNKQKEVMDKGMVKTDQDILESRAREADTRTSTRVKEKDIPKSEIQNDVYDIFRPYIQKLKKAIQGTSAKGHSPGGGRSQIRRTP